MPSVCDFIRNTIFSKLTNSETRPSVRRGEPACVLYRSVCVCSKCAQVPSFKVEWLRFRCASPSRISFAISMPIVQGSGQMWLVATGHPWCVWPWLRTTFGRSVATRSINPNAKAHAFAHQMLVLCVGILRNGGPTLNFSVAFPLLAVQFTFPNDRLSAARRAKRCSKIAKRFSPFTFRTGRCAHAGDSTLMNHINIKVSSIHYHVWCDDVLSALGTQDNSIDRAFRRFAEKYSNFRMKRVLVEFVPHTILLYFCFDFICVCARVLGLFRSSYM